MKLIDKQIGSVAKTYTQCDYSKSPRKVVYTFFNKKVLECNPETDSIIYPKLIEVEDISNDLRDDIIENLIEDINEISR